jgi:hypothetical protein
MTNLTEDVELLVLTYCDIYTVIQFALCNHDKYALVNDSNWLWEQHARAEAGCNIVEPVESWKQLFIELYTTSIDLSFTGPCANHFMVTKATASRLAPTKIVYEWERFFSTRNIYPNTITHLEFRIDEHNSYSNGFRICVGIASKNYWQYDDRKWHYDIVGGEGGFCIIAGSGEKVVNRKFIKTRATIKSGDRIGFIIDNGYTKPDQVNVDYILNGEDWGKLEQNPDYPLLVTEYKAAMSLCSGQCATITKIRTLKRK